MSRLPREEQDGSAEMPYEVGSSSSCASGPSRTSERSGRSRSSSSLPSPTRALHSPPRIVPSKSMKTAVNAASIKKRAPAVVRPWTRQETLDYVQILKDNPHYQKALLRGHRKDASDVDTTDKVSANTYLRNISAALGTGRTHDQMRNKKNWLYKKYDIAIASMEKTGVGLLLSEMKNGTIKNAREQLLIDFPWFDMFHEMERDRASTDPDVLVTGAGEVRLGGSLSDAASNSPSTSADEDDSEQGHSQPSDYELYGDDGPDGLTLLQQASLRAEVRRYEARERGEGNESFSDVDDDGDSAMDLDPVTPRAPVRAKTSIARPHATSLPALSRLAQETDDDPMFDGATRGTRPVTPSPHPSSSKGKTPIRGSDLQRQGSSSRPISSSKSSASSKPSSSSTKRTHTHTSRTSGATEELTKLFQEDRLHRAEVAARASIEKEQTKRFKMELKSQEKERQVEAFERQVRSVQGDIHVVSTRLDNMTILLNSMSAQLTSILARLDKMSV